MTEAVYAVNSLCSTMKSSSDIDMSLNNSRVESCGQMSFLESFSSLVLRRLRFKWTMDYISNCTINCIIIVYKNTEFCLSLVTTLNYYWKYSLDGCMELTGYAQDLFKNHYEKVNRTEEESSSYEQQ